MSTIAAGAHRPRPSRLAGSAVHRVGEDFSRAKGDKGRARDHRDRLDRYGKLELIAGRRGLWTHYRRQAVSEPAADERLSRASRAGVPPAAPVASRDLPPDAEPVTRPRPACVPRGESQARICGIAPPRRCVDEGTAYKLTAVAGEGFCVVLTDELAPHPVSWPSPASASLSCPSSSSSTRPSGSSLASTTGCKRREPAPSPPALGDRRARCWFRGGLTHLLARFRARSRRRRDPRSGPNARRVRGLATESICAAGRHHGAVSSTAIRRSPVAIMAAPDLSD
jgi:hypothetical protein